jgi:hypothetical protein
MRPAAHTGADRVGIQVPAGRIFAARSHWQTVLEAGSRPTIYRLYNTPPRRRTDPGNSMIVEIDGAKHVIDVAAGTSTDVRARRIRVKAGSGGATSSVEGWYVLVS